MRTRESILKIKENRTHKVTNSLGVYDAFKWIRHNKWLDINYKLNESQFYKIIRRVNEEMANNLAKGIPCKFPHYMGGLEIRKSIPHITIKDGKVVTNLPINWQKTLELWEQDEEAYNKRTLIREEVTEKYSIHYKKYRARYKNKSYYGFQPNRQLKLALKDNIKENKVEAFLWGTSYLKS